MSATVVFAPLVPWVLIYALAGLAVALVAFALWRGLSGWWLRGLGLAALLAALANPALQEEERGVLKDLKNMLQRDVIVKADIHLHHEQFDVMSIGG